MVAGGLAQFLLVWSDVNTIRKTYQHGFSLLELMVVVAIVAIVAALAVPAIQTYRGPQKERAAVRRVLDVFAFGRAQAKRLNRAILVDVQGFDTARPNGWVELHQDIGGNCSLAAERRANGADGIELIRRVPFGGTARLGYQGDIELQVGLKNWSHGSSVLSENDVTLCLSPDGAIHRVIDSIAEPLLGELALYIQSFDEAREGLSPKGPPVKIAINFSGGVRTAE